MHLTRHLLDYLHKFSIFVGFPHWSLVSLFSSHLGFLHWNLVYLLCSFHFPFPIAVWFLCFLPILRPAGPPDRSEGWHISWKGFGDLGKGIQFVEGSTGSHQSVQACAIGYFENPTNARKKWWPCNFIELILAWLVIDVQWAKPSCYCHVLLLAIDVIWGFLQYTVHWVAWLHSTSTDLIAFNFPLIVQTNRLTVQLLVTGFSSLNALWVLCFCFGRGCFFWRGCASMMLTLLLYILLPVSISKSYLKRGDVNPVHFQTLLPSFRTGLLLGIWLENDRQV